MASTFRKKKRWDAGSRKQLAGELSTLGFLGFLFRGKKIRSPSDIFRWLMSGDHFQCLDLLHSGDFAASRCALWLKLLAQVFVKFLESEPLDFHVASHLMSEHLTSNLLEVGDAESRSRSLSGYLWLQKVCLVNWSLMMQVRNTLHHVLRQVDSNGATWLHFFCHVCKLDTFLVRCRRMAT